MVLLDAIVILFKAPPMLLYPGNYAGQMCQPLVTRPEHKLYLTVNDEGMLNK